MQEEHRHPHNLGSQQVTHGTVEHHDDHEKKSVLKKVKAKAKKIKDTITKHGHHDDHEQGHGHDQYHYENQHIPDDHDLDEEDDVHDPEIHGAPIYDSAKVRNVTPTGKVKNSGQGVNFGSTTIMGEEHHHHNEPRVVVVKSATENINQSRINEPSRTFVREERTMVQPKVNLEEDPHAPGSRFQAYAPANYQTKVTDPTGIGAAEMDITPIQKSIDRMTVYNEPIPTQQPKTLSTISETQQHPSPSLGIHHQFSPEISAPTKTPYPSSTITHHQNLPQQSPEIKTQYPKSHDQFTPVFSTSTQTQHPTTHDQNLPHFSSGTRTQYPSATTHDHVTPSLLPTEHKPQFSNATKTTSNLLPTEPKPYHSSTISHDTYLPPSSGGTFLPGATESRYPFAGSHDQFKTNLLPTEAKPHLSSATIHDQYAAPYSSATEPNLQHQSVTSLPQHSSAMKTQYPSAGSHLPTEHHSATSHGQYMPQHSGGMKTQYPSAGSHDQFTPEFSTNNRNITVEEQPQLHHESMKNSSNQSNNSYTDKIYSATSAIADKAADAKNAVASKLGYGEKGETTTGEEAPLNQSSYTDKIYSATSAVTGTAAAAKNAVASKLGYGEKGETTTTNEAPSDQSSYTDKIYSAASAVTDKAAGAKNAVASKLGYGETPSNQSSYSSATSAVAPSNQSSYTEKISSATSAIADKAASAKNTVASKLGFGEKNETETNYEENNNNNEKNVSSSSVSPAEYGKKIAVSLTEKLAPVYGKFAGVGTERETGGVEQDKGVSMKEYIAEKLRPGEDDRALSDAISESLYKKSVDESVEEVYHNDEGSRDVRKVVSDAVHKRGDDEGRKMERPRGKVTESEEVKRRLGGWDEEVKEGDFGKGMVDMVKGVVGSWFEKPEENESTQGTGDLSKNTSGEVRQVHQTAGERRLHESTN
ncbi:low-temperature-induced 65 kDa protein-like [Trifolium pratense]|nr:low-temperature-induced 65 kDa protein-like [Trifolium pratense]